MSDFVVVMTVGLLCFVVLVQTVFIFAIAIREELRFFTSSPAKIEAQDQDEEEEEEPFALKFTSNPNIRRSFDQELKDLEKEMEVDVDDPNNESGKW